MEGGEWACKCTRQAGNECGQIANMGLKPEASHLLIARKLINVIIVRSCKVKESQDQRSTTVHNYSWQKRDVRGCLMLSLLVW